MTPRPDPDRAPTWGDLFERAAGRGVEFESIRDALERRRDAATGEDER